MAEIYWLVCILVNLGLNRCCFSWTVELVFSSAREEGDFIRVADDFSVDDFRFLSFMATMFGKY